MCQPYIESTTHSLIVALSDVDDEEPQEIPVFVRLQKWTSSSSYIAGPRNVSIDLKHDVLCL